MSSSASARAAVAAARPATRWLWPLVAVFGVGFVLRLLFLPSLGFHNDVAAFEAWTLALRDNPPWLFYTKTSFADYPPGYFVVLWVLAKVYVALTVVHVIPATDANWFGLRLLVKLPALAMDFVDAGLIYVLVRRYAAQSIALAAAGLYVLNPATIYTSAYWGQVDSVSWGLVLLAVWLTIRSADDAAKTVSRLTWAWLAIAYSILIKPQGALVAFVMLAFVATAPDAGARRLRATGTALGVGASIVLAYAVAALFHGNVNPVADFAWLLQRYQFGSAVYPYNSVNAFNLYAIKQPFWQSDLAQLTFLNVPLGPVWAWGIALTLAATALIVARYVQKRSEQAFLDAAFLVAFGFFILATRMHERYIYGAFLLIFPLIGFGRRYTWSAVLLSVTTLLNLVYSFAYQSVMEAHTPNVDPTNLWPIGSHLIAGVNVALFFVAGYAHLGGDVGVLEGLERDASAFGARARTWFDPREGIAAMTRIDWLWAGGLTVASFVQCILWIRWPAEKVFDEIYYARAGEEYLKHLEIFEFTHPPLTKLLITLSMTLFGGLNGDGDTALGWRFLNVVIGALMVGVLYLFAKRLTRSTPFAIAAAGMLLFDGFHYVQSRIATPEITVAFFSLCVLYAFYRLWTASGARRVPVIDRSRQALAVAAAILAVGAVVGALVATAAINLGPHNRGPEMRPYAWIVAFLYVEVLFYLFARWLLGAGRERLLARFVRTPDPGTLVSYADGSRYTFAPAPVALVLPEGETVPVDRGKARGDLVVRDDGAAHRRYARDGALAYETPAATAAFAPDATIAAGGATEDGNSVTRWILILALFGGLLAASKWNGLFDFFVAWICIALVVAQRFLRRPALFGNPFGMPLDVVVGAMFVVGGAIYTLSYIPFFLLGHNFLDMVALQTEMYHYHASLVATHPYASSWWQWPILERPISYFYQEYPPYQQSKLPTDCCVAEILALPNPFVWWAGLVTVPAVAVLGWLHRNRGYALLAIAYFLQWLPWIGSPRIAFEYHFFPNLAIIVLCNAIVLQHLWHWAEGRTLNRYARAFVGTFLVVVVAGFWYFFPVLAGVHTPWDVWHARMWIPRWII